MTTRAHALAYFDNTKETVLNLDASIKGLGAVTMQDGKPVAFGSKTLTTCERRYANIERERATGNCLGSTKVSHVCVWAQSDRGNGSQTAGVNLPEASK